MVSLQMPVLRPDVYFVAGEIPPSPWSFSVYDDSFPPKQQLLTNVQSVTFFMWLANKVRQPPTIDTAVATAVVAADGFTRLQYTPVAADLANPGEYWGRFKVTFTGGFTLSYPNPTWLPIHGAQSSP